MQTATNINPIKYVAPPTVLKFTLQMGAKAKYIQGPFGSSKTVGAIFDRVLAANRFFKKYTLEHCKQLGIKENIRKRRTVVVRNTWPELRETVLKTFLEWFGDHGHWTAGTKTFRFYNDDHEIIFLGLDRPDDVKRVRGLEVSDFILSEASEIPQDIFLGLMGRMGRFPKLKDKRLYTDIEWESTGVCESNPPDDADHWLVEEFETDPKEGYYAFFQPGGMMEDPNGGTDQYGNRTHIPNPEAENIDNLPLGYYEELYDKYASRPDLQTRYVLGKRAVMVRGKGVYTSHFKKGFHTTVDKPHYPAGAVVVSGWDNSGNVPAAVVGWRNPNGMIDIVKEFVTDRSGIVDFADELITWRNLEFGNATTRDISDPAGHAEYSSATGGLTSNAKLTYEKFGVKLIKGTQAFQIRREAVTDYLTKLRDGGPALRIYAPGCPRLIAALEGGYCYRKLPDNKGYSPEPDKNKYSHIAESLQYLCSWLIGSNDTKPAVKILPPSGRWSG